MDTREKVKQYVERVVEGEEVGSCFAFDEYADAEDNQAVWKALSPNVRGIKREWDGSRNTVYRLTDENPEVREKKDENQIVSYLEQEFEEYDSISEIDAPELLEYRDAVGFQLTSSEALETLGECVAKALNQE